MRSPVRLVGSGQVAVSFGSGISGSGLCSRSKRTSRARALAGVRRSPVGARSMAQEVAMSGEREEEGRVSAGGSSGAERIGIALEAAGRKALSGRASSFRRGGDT